MGFGSRGSTPQPSLSVLLLASCRRSKVQATQDGSHSPLARASSRCVTLKRLGRVSCPVQQSAATVDSFGPGSKMQESHLRATRVSLSSMVSRRLSTVL